jgi:hypothetical protein
VRVRVRVRVRGGQGRGEGEGEGVGNESGTGLGDRWLRGVLTYSTCSRILQQSDQACGGDGKRLWRWEGLLSRV